MNQKLIIIISAVLVFILLLALLMIVGALIRNDVPLLKSPGLLKRLLIYGSTNVAETESNPIFPELEIKTYDIPPEELYQQVLQAVMKLDWDILIRDAENNTIKAVITTKLWQFEDDITITAQPHEQGSQLYIRSASRVGKGDLGANLSHVLKLYDAMNQADLDG